MDTRELYAVTIHRDAVTRVSVFEEWRKDGVQHREDGPAMFSRDPSTGVVIKERWIRNNQLHREDGPAVILRNAVTGRVYCSEWYKNGVKVPAPKPVRRQLSRTKKGREAPTAGPNG